MLKSAKKISKKLFNSYNNLVINIFDYFAPLQGMENGYLIERSIIFDELLIKELKEKILTKLKYSDNKVSNVELNEEFQLKFLEKLLPRINSLIKSYLGKAAKLDYIFVYCLNTVEIDKNNFSGVPHHDSVGRRLKVFIPLSEGDSEVNTFYIKNSSNIKYRDYSNYPKETGERINKYWKENQVINLSAPIGGFYIFDTNGIHWGDYEIKENNFVSPWRMAIVLEFSTTKSFFINGKVGPRLSFIGINLKKLLKQYNLYSKRHILRSNMKTKV